MRKPAASKTRLATVRPSLKTTTGVGTDRRAVRHSNSARPAVAPYPKILPLILLTLMLSAAWASAQVPALVNYQGRVAVHGTNFEGTGLFKFALVNSNGTVSFWSHDGTSSGGSEPSSAVPLPVAGGLFSVNLGDRSVPNMTAALPAWVFTNTDVRLRLWFNDGVSGSQQLTPDQRITSAAYALMAGGVPSGVITSPMLAAGAVSSNALAANAISTLNILDGTLTDADLSTNARINASKIVGGDLMAARLKVGTNHVLTGIFASIAGGDSNTNKGDNAVILGGYGNEIAPLARQSSIVGGQGNAIKGSAVSVIGGGERNTIQTNSPDSVIAGGADNMILTNAQLATISGGWHNTVVAGATLAAIGGGQLNRVESTQSTIGGGQANVISSNGGFATVAGGTYNTVATEAWLATIGGGANNTASGAVSFIGGGERNKIQANSTDAVIAGGADNVILANAPLATISGGWYNTNGNGSATISGGRFNTANGYVSTVPGGLNNTAGGAYSFAAGRRAKALHDGSFVWGDGTDADFASTGNNQFLIRADRVGIGTSTPVEKLHVNGARVRVEGDGHEQAYMGGDGAGGDVEFGSMNPNVTRAVFWNSANFRPLDMEAAHGTFCAVTILGGCDLAEPFEVSTKDIPEGAVVVIDGKNPGALKLSDRPYDKRVAGVISGANGVNPGLTLSQKGVLDGEQQVALTGRVYVQADASHGAIEPGDLLTTSATPGHAMKVTDHVQAQGAVLGKAMSALKEGQGLVLVLVSLQ